MIEWQLDFYFEGYYDLIYWGKDHTSLPLLARYEVMTVVLSGNELGIFLEEILFYILIIYECIYGNMERVSLKWSHWFLLVL